VIYDSDKQSRQQILWPIALVWGTLLVAQLVEVLRYKPVGRGIDSRWCLWNFSLT
jgi:hypothetical protein